MLFHHTFADAVCKTQLLATAVAAHTSRNNLAKKIAPGSHISTSESSGFFPETVTFQTETNKVLKLIKGVLERMRTLERNGLECVPHELTV